MITEKEVDLICKELVDCELNDIADFVENLYTQYKFRLIDMEDLHELMKMTNSSTERELKNNVKNLQCSANILTEKCKDYEQEIKDWQEGYELRFKDLCKLDEALDNACERLELECPKAYGIDEGRTWKKYLLKEVQDGKSI